MLRELKKHEVQIRELNDLEMEMVSGGEGTVDEVIGTGVRFSNPYEGMTGEQILRMHNFQLPQIHINIPVTFGGGTPAPTDNVADDSPECVAAQSLISSADASNRDGIIGSLRDLMGGQFGQSNSRDADALVNSWLRSQGAQGVEEHC